jgi:hypothetical protein
VLRVMLKNHAAQGRIARDKLPNAVYSSSMPKRSSKKKDAEPQQIARRVLDAVVPDAEVPRKKASKNPAAVALGRLGGKKGGPARAEKLSAAKRSEIASRAARARWVAKTNDSN